jgi:RNase P subunit RPR2
MTALERITNHLHGNQDRAFCDDCLSKILSIRPRQAVQQKTYRLARDARYERVLITCAGCKKTNKFSIRKRLTLAS